MGWYDALLNFAGGAAPAVDRYTQLRGLREDKQLARQQQEFENRLKQQQAEQNKGLYGLQAQQLQDAILRGKRQDFVGSHIPGMEMSPESMTQANELGLGGLVKPGGTPSPLMSAVGKMAMPGKMYELGEPGGPVQEMQGADPSMTGRMYGLPDEPFTPDKWMGTYEQQQSEQQRMMQLQAMLGVDLNDPDSLLRYDVASGNQPDARRYQPTQRGGSTTVNPFTMALQSWMQANPGQNPTPEQIGQINRSANPLASQGQGQQGPGMLSPYAESNVIQRLSTAWANANSSANDLKRAHTLMKVGMDAARRGDLAQGSQAILVTFQKTLDPTSVVRESEYARSASGQSVMNQMAGFIERMEKGGTGVTLAELEKYEKLADEMVNAQNLVAAQSGERERLGRIADRYSIPHDIIFATPVTPPDASPTAGGQSTAGTVAVRTPDGKVRQIPLEDLQMALLPVEQGGGGGTIVTGVQ